nr:MAG: replication initiator protein [Microviridae sp.]
MPCGRCTACRINRTREWATRITHELSYWEYSSFVTLTYNNENINKEMSLKKRDLQLFFKRLRKTLGKEKIKYYACGEYGENFGRPHYHAIIFGIQSNDKRIKDSWPAGFVRCGSVTYESARYVAGYIQKKYNGKLAEEVYGNKERPFQLQSQGLGKQWALDNETGLIENLGLTINGKKTTMPRYYRKILGDKITEERMEQERISKANDLDEQYGKAQYDWRNIVQHKLELPVQREAEINTRVERWNKRKF